MASGDTLAPFPASAWEARVSTGGALIQRGSGDYLHKSASLPDAGTHGFFYDWVVPSHYDGGGVTVVVGYRMTSATANEIVMQVDIQNITTVDIDSAASFGTATTVEETVPGTAGGGGTFSAAISHANAGSPSAGDQLMLRIQRLGDSSSPADDATGNVELSWIEIRET